MTRIILDRALREKLNGLDARLELCDEAGHTLGYFIPASLNEPSKYTNVTSPISDEELERRSRESGGRTLSEIWAGLGRS